MELEESSRIDGAGPLRTFFQIVLPNARPAVMTLVVLQFLANWNDFIWPLYTMFSDTMLTLPIGLSRLQGAYTIDYPVIMAGAAIAAVTGRFAAITPPNAETGSHSWALRWASATSAPTAMPHGLACLMIATHGSSKSCAAR